LISKSEKPTSIQLLEALATVTRKISDSLKYQLSAEQIDSLAKEHRQVMEQIQKIPKAELKPQQHMLKTIQTQVQNLQDELGNYHQAVKEKLISFGQKRKQVSAYNALS